MVELQCGMTELLGNGWTCNHVSYRAIWNSRRVIEQTGFGASSSGGCSKGEGCSKIVFVKDEA